MGLKAGWLALFVFVWIIGAFLGSTFEYQSTSAAQGTSYTTGTATFTTGSAVVGGAGTAWADATMAGGLMKCNDDGVWYKILSVTNPTTLTLVSIYNEAGGAGKNYTMTPSQGWSGTGTGGYEESPVTTLQYLMNVSNAVQRLPLLGNIPLPVPNGEYFKTAFKVLTWQFSFLYNEDGSMAFGLFYWIFLVPFCIMGVLSMILLVYGLITGNITWG